MIKQTKNGVVLLVHVQPNAKKNSVEGIDEWRGRIKIKVSAPPVGGKANRELTKFLSKLLEKEIVILRGETSREKELLIRGASIEDVKKKLGI
ncbi:MAG TPA: YggU family protein [Thermococcus paralvinellae]|uniref:UPF0235 protein EYH24_06020 n=1 Tax=Thermococcus paralvinellae TaxID=582419 RepID=A0A833E4C4_9EURY|nr:YggU family protein [Thermococcus paralvinellae]